jgi:pimeloyl-ACP methyl ester carboxylesterase
MVMRSLVVGLGILVLLFSFVGFAGAQGKVQTELVLIKTSDKVDLYGAVWSPTTGKARLGFVLGQGTGAEYYESWLAWFGPKLAEMGYMAISLNRRDHGQEFGYYNMEPSAIDHKLAIDFLMNRGVESVILAGHSYGTVTVPYYMMATKDSRVKAMLLFAALGDLRPASVIICGGKEKYDAIVAKSKEMVAAGKGNEAFLIPPLVPGGRPIVNTYENFLNKRGPDSKAAPIEILKNVPDMPILAIRDPGDPYPATKPPAQQQLLAANKNLDYILLYDIRNGGSDPAAHGFSGREDEVFSITVDWMRRKGLLP